MLRCQPGNDVPDTRNRQQIDEQSPTFQSLVIAAGNPASERGVHFAMPRPLRNRFVHLELEADLSDWCRWAVGAGVRPEIIAFLRFKPDLLHAADTTSDANAWARSSSGMSSGSTSSIGWRTQISSFRNGSSSPRKRRRLIGPPFVCPIRSALRTMKRPPRTRTVVPA
jgi:hypothetical protein